MLSEQPTSGALRRWKDKSAYYLLPLFGMLRFKFTLVNLLCGLIPDFASGVLRGRLYRLIGFDIGQGAYIMGNLHLPTGMSSFYNKLTIGQDTVVGDHVTINLDAEVRIGKNVAIGPRVLIYTGTHQIGPSSKRRIGVIVVKPVTIEDGCWIGLAAVILPGVTIGHGSIIAAGAMVDKDVPPDSYVEGNPAQVVRQLPWGDR